MAVRDTLDTIVERHPDVIGAIVFADDTVVHNLEAPYDMVSVDDLMTSGSEIFEQMGVLAEEGLEFDDLVMEFPLHVVLFRAFENGLLAVIAPQLERGPLVKLQVSLGVYAKSIRKVLGGSSLATVACAPDNVSDGDDQNAAVPFEVEAECDNVRPFMRRPRVGSRSRSLPLTFVDNAADAISTPIPKAIEDDGAALRQGGKPKVKPTYPGTKFHD